MMILRSSATSPFGRKIKIAAALLGLGDRISVVMSNTLDPSDSIRDQNPIGKIPALILEDGTVLFDSPVIAEYLDFIAGGDRLMPPVPARFETLRLQALADGIADAALLCTYENRMRPPSLRSRAWIDHQVGKIERGLTSLENGTLPEIGTLPDIGTIALACMLGYLDLRVGGWRDGYPKLTAWVDAFEQAIPVFTETRPPV